LIKIVDEARQVLVKEGRLTEATLTAYGKNLREEITFTKHAIPTIPKLPKPSYAIPTPPQPSSALATFDACRAELTCAAGRVIVWANVTGKPTVALNSGGENIGVSVTPGLFEGSVRPVISHAIESTMHLPSDTVATLLNKISEQLIPKFRPMVG
jgi:hypothetical protein